jgi:hypothetical protein
MDPTWWPRADSMCRRLEARGRRADLGTMVRLADLSPRARVLVFAVLIPGFIGAGWYVMAGERQMERASEFVARATSVRVVVEKAGAATRTIDIQCPDKARVETRQSRFESSVSLVVVGDRAVIAQPDGRWLDVPAAVVGIPAVCSGSPWSNGRPGLAAALHALTEPGQRVDDAQLDVTLPSGETCRTWRVHTKWDIGPDTTDQPRLCLDEDDAHPVIIMFADGRSLTFSRWNQRVDIALPGGVAPVAPRPAEPTAAR